MEGDKQASSGPVFDNFTPSMDIYAAPGTRVVFLGIRGREDELEQAKEELTVGKAYTVRRVRRRSSYTDVWLEEYFGSFNSVLFGPESVLFPECPQAEDPRQSQAQSEQTVQVIDSHAMLERDIDAILWDMTQRNLTEAAADEAFELHEVSSTLRRRVQILREGVDSAHAALKRASAQCGRNPELQSQISKALDLLNDAVKDSSRNVMAR